MIFADKLIELRKKNGWSQEELAEKLSVTRQSVSKWEGAQSIPELSKILQMAQMFGVTTDYLLRDEIEAIECTEAEEWDRPALRRVSMEEADAFLRVKRLERLMQNLYEDKCSGVIPQPVFQTLMNKYETERAHKAASLPELEKKVRTQLEARHDASHWAALIQRYTEITELDETILFALVDRIEIGETKRVNSMRVCDVKVFYRYVGNVDAALSPERQDAV